MGAFPTEIRRANLKRMGRPLPFSLFTSPSSEIVAVVLLAPAPSTCPSWEGLSGREHLSSHCPALLLLSCCSPGDVCLSGFTVANYIRKKLSPKESFAERLSQRVSPRSHPNFIGRRETFPERANQQRICRGLSDLGVWGSILANISGPMEESSSFTGVGMVT